jgi:DtxR family Mn-dependent transcriptional regulator
VSLTTPDDGAARSLAECRPGEAFRLARVLDQSSDFLRYLTDCGLGLGAVGTVEGNPDGAGLMRIRVGRTGLSIALDAAGKLVVTDA